MKIARIRLESGEIRYAQVTSNGLELLEGDPFAGLTSTDKMADAYALLAPIIPSVILCIGLNYRAHAEEMKARLPEYPVLFFKNPSALLDPGAFIKIPQTPASTQVDYEGELAVVIGRTCKNVTRSNALDFVLGYTAANDVSARDWQKQWGGSQWCRGKSFDTFAPLGPYLVTPDEISNPNSLKLTTRVNGEVCQDSNTSDMIFDIPSLIEFLSGETTLAPGTVIFTGTPSGVGLGRTPPCWLQAGDRVEVEIECIGVLRNGVK